MALSGQLSDLSLAELIEFFCNQRKTGRLKVAYETTPGFFYFDRGDLVDAKIGSLNGVEAIYYSLTLANASFKFSPAFEPARRTIHQPWTQVTLEGLRRLDEGIKPKAPVSEDGVSYLEDPDGASESVEEVEYDSESGMPLSLMVDSAAGNGGKSKMIYAAVAVAVLALVAVAGIPAGWYSKGKAVAVAAQPVASAPAPEAQASSDNADAAAQPEQPAIDPNSAEATASTGEANALAAKRAREAKDRARMAEVASKQAAAANQPAGQPGGVDTAKKSEAVKPGPKMVTVQVSYDEAGRVTQTSGGDGTAQRIARQKRFPAGKSGTTTITIPIN